MGQVALAWLCYRPLPVIPILGARKLTHLHDNLASFDRQLTSEHVARTACTPKNPAHLCLQRSPRSNPRLTEMHFTRAQLASIGLSGWFLIPTPACLIRISIGSRPGMSHKKVESFMLMGKCPSHLSRPHLGTGFCLSPHRGTGYCGDDLFPEVFETHCCCGTARKNVSSPF